MYCPQCGAYVNANMAQHVMDFHLTLGQLWRYPVEWCSVWKGTVHKCMDHLRARHNADSSVEDIGQVLSALDSDSCSMECGLAFWRFRHRHGRHVVSSAQWPMVHQYCIYADPLSHVSLQGPVIHSFRQPGFGGGPLTIMKAQILRSAGADSKLDQRDHRTLVSASPAWKAGHQLATLQPLSRSLLMSRLLLPHRPGPLRWMGRHLLTC